MWVSFDVDDFLRFDDEAAHDPFARARATKNRPRLGSMPDGKKGQNDLESSRGAESLAEHGFDGLVGDRAPRLRERPVFADDEPNVSRDKTRLLESRPDTTCRRLLPAGSGTVARNT
jgi:hypothetical protein